MFFLDLLSGPLSSFEDFRVFKRGCFGDSSSKPLLRISSIKNFYIFKIRIHLNQPELNIKTLKFIQDGNYIAIFSCCISVAGNARFLLAHFVGT